MDFLQSHWLDMLTTALGLAYIIFEYRASIWLWAIGFAMQSLGIVLYYQKGLYADCGMEFYYLAMTVYGWWKWTRLKNATTIPGESRDKTITHFPLRLALLWTVITLAAWAGLYLFLTTCTDSTVPLADSFTTALSFVGIWALARKYLEQWLIWIVVDVVTCVLYFYKDIPFKAGLYALYVVIAVLGYRKWRRMMGKSAIVLLAACLLASCSTEPEYADPEAHEKTVKLHEQYSPFIVGTWHYEYTSSAQRYFERLTFQADGTFTGMRKWQICKLIPIEDDQLKIEWEDFALSGSFTGTWNLRYWSPEGNPDLKRNCITLNAAYDDERDYMPYFTTLSFGYADETTLRIESYWVQEEDGWADYQRGEGDPGF